MKKLICALAFAGLATSTALAAEVTVTDVVGRTVTIDAPVKAAILGEGRILYGVAIVERENPFERIVGWPQDVKKNDPGTWNSYKAKFPDAEKVASVGEMKKGEFDAEQAVALGADVVIMNHESKKAADDAGLEAKLTAVGIPLVYVDFRDEPMKNTEPTLRLLGELFDEKDRAEEFIKYRAEQIAKVTDVLQKNVFERPLVFLDRAAGATDECCWSFGNANFGEMVELAGGTNLSKDLIPGSFGSVNPEQVVASNPDVVIATSADWSATSPGGIWIGLGPDADPAAAQVKLEALMARPAYSGIKAVNNRKFFAVWHQFYNSPYQYAVIQQMAKWLHPELFADLDPEATLRETHERFLPISYQPGYFAALKQ